MNNTNEFKTYLQARGLEPLDVSKALGEDHHRIMKAYRGEIEYWNWVLLKEQYKHLDDMSGNGHIKTMIDPWGSTFFWDGQSWVGIENLPEDTIPQVYEGEQLPTKTFFTPDELVKIKVIMNLPDEPTSSWEATEVQTNKLDIDMIFWELANMYLQDNFKAANLYEFGKLFDLDFNTMNLVERSKLTTFEDELRQLWYSRFLLYPITPGRKYLTIEIEEKIDAKIQEVIDYFYDLSGPEEG